MWPSVNVKELEKLIEERSSAGQDVSGLKTRLEALKDEGTKPEDIKLAGSASGKRPCTKMKRGNVVIQSMVGVDKSHFDGLDELTEIE
jgi:hypothetical protein